MKWYNHRLVTACCVYAATGSVVPTLLAFQGSIIPDSVEGNDYTSESWRANHRKISHFWPCYFFPVILCVLYLKTMVLPWTMAQWLIWFQNDAMDCIIGGFIYTILWLCIGALLHLAEDFICGGVPLFKPDKRVGIHLFKVGTPQEFQVSFALMVLFLTISYFRFY